MKTSELTGAALDWAVSKCEGVDVTHLYAWDYSTNRYSTDWAHGGPIVEREKISLIERAADGWCADIYAKDMQYGPTPLIAAMRCFVCSKLGDEVDVPEELK